MINISGDYTFGSSREDVWSHLLDPDFLIDIIPGCESLACNSEGEYHGEIRVGLAGISGSYTTQLKITDIMSPGYCSFEGEVNGKTGSITGQVIINLFEDNERCRMDYEGRGIITGALAHINSRFLEGIAQSLISHGLSKMDRKIKFQVDDQAIIEKSEE